MIDSMNYYTVATGLASGCLITTGIVLIIPAVRRRFYFASHLAHGLMMPTGIAMAIVHLFYIPERSKYDLGMGLFIDGIYAQGALLIGLLALWALDLAL